MILGEKILFFHFSLENKTAHLAIFGLNVWHLSVLSSIPEVEAVGSNCHVYHWQWHPEQVTSLLSALISVFGD